MTEKLFTIEMVEDDNGETRVTVTPHRHYSGSQLIQMLTLCCQNMMLTTLEAGEKLGISEEQILGMIEGVKPESGAGQTTVK